MGKTLTIDLDAFHKDQPDVRVRNFLYEIVEKALVKEPPPAPSREEELLGLLSLIRRFWEISTPNEKIFIAKGKVWLPKEGYGPDWATSDDAAEEAAKVAVRKWGGLLIRHDIAGRWSAFIWDRAVWLAGISEGGNILGAASMATRGEAALRAVIAASEKWKD